MYEALAAEPPKEEKPKSDRTIRRYASKQFAKFGRLIKAYNKRKSRDV